MNANIKKNAKKNKMAKVDNQGRIYISKKLLDMLDWNLGKEINMKVEFDNDEGIFIKLTGEKNDFDRKKKRESIFD